MDDIETIKQRVNIVDLIQEYLPLKKTGINFRANCPFHQEKTPSFMVSPERGIFHCFGCGVGGDQFKFLMEKEGIEFKEALEILAQKAGVTLKKSSKETDAKQELFEINLKAQQFYQYLLTKHPLGKNALDYLKKRGLTDQTIEQFGLGYAPQNWEVLTRFLKKRGFSISDMISSGLCVSSKSGCYDRFRGRIIFPLIDVRNRVLGFSGRILDKGEPARNAFSITDAGGPKYVNTPQTPIFDKGKFLFGLHLSKVFLREKKEAVIVEGEMDMLMSFQSGVKNIIASKGTALTFDQIEALKKYTETISLCFDTDLAGDAASRRGIELSDQAGLNIKVIQVEGGSKDPADVCLKDPKAWEKMVFEAVPIYDYYLDSVSNRFDLRQASSKRAIFAELLPIWKKISDQMVKEHYIQKLGALLQVKDDFIRKALASPLNVKSPVSESKPQKISNGGKKEFSRDRRELLEEYLISLILHLPKDSTYVPNFPETLFTMEHLKQIYVLLVIFLDSISFRGKSFKIQDYIKTVPEALVPIIDTLFLNPIDEKILGNNSSWQKEIDLVVSELKKLLIKSSLEKLSLQIKSAQEFEKIENLENLNRKFRDLSLKLRNL